jgi:hypothetical protein
MLSNGSYRRKSIVLTAFAVLALLIAAFPFSFAGTHHLPDQLDSLSAFQAIPPPPMALRAHPMHQGPPYVPQPSPRPSRQSVIAARYRAPAAPAASPPAFSPAGSPQQIAAAMLGSFGWPMSQFGCLNSLWTRESGWNYQAENPSGAYGIPQALPGSKMASAGPDWQTNPATQIRWGLTYIKDDPSYGSPCAAWDHEEAFGYY